MDGRGTDDRRMHQGRTPGREPGRPHQREEEPVDLRDAKSAAEKPGPDRESKLAKGSHTAGGKGN